MELRVLKYFLVVAREENITRAAKQLHITQPTLSRQLMQLEEELDVKLFRRSKHSIILTADGLLLRRRAQELVELADKTERELQHQEESISGEISIGCGETENVAWLAKAMTAFRRSYPDVTFELYTAIADDVKERMENGTLDFGLLLEPVDISKYSFVRMPARDTWTILLRKDHPLAQKQSICPADLAGQPIIMAKRESVKNQLEHWAGSYYKEFQQVAVLNLSFYNKEAVVTQGLGMALGLSFPLNSSVLCQRPLEPVIENGCFLAWKKDQFHSAAVAKFIEYTQSYFEESMQMRNR
ncbi:MAG: LysR family transcriptional regulator [Megasphaera sp.]|jgi:DNA-binding transcriptional LysR family regulator|nr:LysR family transcriptional regulator [Megasphaera sp.]